MEETTLETASAFLLSILFNPKFYQSFGLIALFYAIHLNCRKILDDHDSEVQRYFGDDRSHLEREVLLQISRNKYLAVISYTLSNILMIGMILLILLIITNGQLFH
tara:strand:- start:85 stop:402 length:318 start_codon:yes stop_codon:yes gene_type:complete